MQKTRTVEGIGMMEGLQGGFGGKDFFARVGAADGAAGIGSGDDELSGSGDV